MELSNLTHLELFQIHDNRIVGAIPHIVVNSTGISSFVADCGMPTAFGDPLICDDCTMCCNSQGDCEDNVETLIQKIDLQGFEGYLQSSWFVFLAVFGACCTVYLVSYLYEKHKKHQLNTITNRRQTAIIRENVHALDAIGNDSVYQFVLSNSWLAWGITLATMVAQILVLLIFVKAAEFDVTDDNSDFVYTWKCPRDADVCEDKADLDDRGWAAFGILMIAHLSKDLINGLKMVKLSTKEGHHLHARIRFFIGGTLLCGITSFTLFTSAIYNKAIATSNTEIIANSVIIIFVTDIDELVYDILTVIDQRWVESLSHQQQDETQGTGNERNDELHRSAKSDGSLKDEVQDLREEVESLCEAVRVLSQQKGETK